MNNPIPQLHKPTTVDFDYYGSTIVFRKPNLGEQADFSSEYHLGTNTVGTILFKMLAKLLLKVCTDTDDKGSVYKFEENTEEEKITFIRELEISSEEFLELASKLGVWNKKDEKNKSEINNETDLTELICYLIEKTGYSIDYIYSLDIDVFKHILDGFINLDAKRNNVERNNNTSENALEEFYQSHKM